MTTTRCSEESGNAWPSACARLQAHIFSAPDSASTPQLPARAAPVLRDNCACQDEWSTHHVPAGLSCKPRPLASIIGVWPLFELDSCFHGEVLPHVRHRIPAWFCTSQDRVQQECLALPALDGKVPKHCTCEESVLRLWRAPESSLVAKPVSRSASLASRPDRSISGQLRNMKPDLLQHKGVGPNEDGHHVSVLQARANWLLHGQNCPGIDNGSQNLHHTVTTVANLATTAILLEEGKQCSASSSLPGVPAYIKLMRFAGSCLSTTAHSDCTCSLGAMLTGSNLAFSKLSQEATP